MTPHALRFLGLGPDADERAIKRAYAARLKTTRPDEDPEGFQRLNEAYQAALQWAKQRPARPAPSPVVDLVVDMTVAPSIEAPEPIREPAPEAEEAPPAFEGGATFRFEAPPLQPSLPPLPPASRLHVRPAEEEGETDDAPPPPAPSRLRIREAPPAAGMPDTVPPVAPPPSPRLRVTDAPPLPPPAEDAPPWRRLRVSSGPVDAPPDTYAPLPPEDEVPLDPARFHRECLTLAANASRATFEGWLRAQPALWSIVRKAALGRGLFDLLRTQLPPVPEVQFDVIVAFFAIDDVHSGYDPLVVQQLRATLHAAWVAARELAGDGEIEIPVKRGWPVYGAARTEAALARIDQLRREAVVARLAAAYHPELLRRWSWWRVFRNLLSRQRVAEVAEAVEQLGDAPGDRFDPRALRFWRQAADDTRWSWPHTLLAFSRCLAAALGVVALLLVISLPIVIDEGGWGLYFGIGGGVLATTFGAWLGYASIRHFVRWQTEDDPPAGAMRLLHRAAVPLLALLGVGISLTGAVNALAIVVVLFAAVVSILRQSQRNGSFLPHIDWDAHAGWGLLRIVLLLLMVGTLFHLAISDAGGPWFCSALAALALLFWSIDRVRQRGRAPR